MTPSPWSHRKEALVVLGVALGLIGTAWSGIRVFVFDIGAIATDSDVKKGLESHDIAPLAHPDLRNDVKALSAQDAALQERIGMSKADVVALGAKLVYVMAQNAEPNPRYKGHAGVFYERLYGRLVLRGVPVHEAITEALDSPWPAKPK